jgi:integrase
MVFYSSELPHEANENGFRPHYYQESPDFSTMRSVTFVETIFIPEHETRKTFTGRSHYCAILKHVLHPEAVDRMFGQHHSAAYAKLRTLRGWPYMDDVPMRDVTPAHVTRIVLAAFAQGCDAQTVKLIRNVIGAIISHAINENFLHGNNPVSSVPLPPIVRKRTQPLDTAQVRSVLRLMKYSEREMTLIAIAMGMSISEICGMQWKHVNLTRAKVERDLYSIPPRSILVRQQWNARDLVEIRAGGSRYVQIPDALADGLSILKAQQPNSDPDVFVLTSELGSPISSATARDTILKPIGRRLNMPWPSWQVIKRTHLSLMMELRTQPSHDLVLNLG